MTRKCFIISFSLLIALRSTLLAQDANSKGQLAASGNERETARSLPVAASKSPRPSAGTVSEPTNLLTGAKWTYSFDDGKTFSATPPTIKADTTVNLRARTEFEAADLSGMVVLELTHGLPTRQKMLFFLNGEQIKPQMEGMNYKTYRAIDAEMLKKGKNVLTAGITIKNVSRGKRKARDIQFKVAMRLAALKAEHLKIQTGPILGAFGNDYFTVTCRMNMPAEMSLGFFARGKEVPVSIPGTNKGLMHRFRVKGYSLKDVHCYWLTFRARKGGDDRVCMMTYKWDVPRFGSTQHLRFVAMGDSRTYPKDWAKVAGAVVKAKPDLVVFSGDMVARGRNDWEWDEQFFAPAKKLFTTIPFYAVIGNHEANAPLYNELFYTPSKDGKNRNWAQEINGVLLIGLDGEKDFSAGSENYKWLEKTLSESKANFIFAFNHYPAWSSSGHGRLDDETGQPKEKAVCQARDVFMPLLTKYKATAYICGHDHCYERSELPGGLTHIISGGAGAPLRKKAENAEKQNPHSKVFHSVLHYCLFESKGDMCTVKVVTLEGKVIDTRGWKARD